MSESLQAVYFSMVFLAMLYIFHKVRLNRISVLLVLIFWQGLFQYISNVSGSNAIADSYKIIVVVYAFTLSWKKILNAHEKHDKIINILFILFSVSFWVTYLLYGGGILTILSQYLFKYGLVWILYHYFKDIVHYTAKREYLKRTLLFILYVQIGLSIIKIMLFGFAVEPIVGSMSAGGAGTAVVIPIVGLVFYWLIKNRKFTRWEWVITAMIFIIAIASGKRQPIAFYPAILFGLLVFVEKKIRPAALIKYIPIVLMIFYIGIRLTPTLTPENKVGGSFDISHVRDYALMYYFGTTQAGMIFSEDYVHFGRGGAIASYFQPRLLTLYSYKEMLFGKGRYEVAIGAHGRFHASSSSDYGIQHSGLMGEAGAMLYSFGYVGTILMIILAGAFIGQIKNKKLMTVVLLFYLWDFMFYYNQVIFSNQSALIVLFIIFYANFSERRMRQHYEIKRAYNSEIQPHILPL